MISQTKRVETVSARDAAKQVGVHYVTLRRWLASKKFRPSSGGVLLDGGKRIWRFTADDIDELRTYKRDKYCSGRGRKPLPKRRESPKKRKVPMHTTRTYGLIMKWHIVTTTGYPVVHGFINGEQCMTWQLKANSRRAAERAVRQRLDEIIQENHAKRVTLAISYLREFSDTRTAKRAAVTDGHISENDDFTWDEAIYKHAREKRLAEALVRGRKADKSRLHQA